MGEEGGDIADTDLKLLGEFWDVMTDAEKLLGELGNDMADAELKLLSEWGMT